MKRKITDKMIEAGLRAEWRTFYPGGVWPDGCPPGSRDRWRNAFAAGLYAAIRANEAK